MKKLQKLADNHLNGVVETYQGMARPWTDEVDEAMVEGEINSPEFQAFVKMIEADALGDGIRFVD